MTFGNIREETKGNDAYIRRRSEVLKLIIIYECELDVQKKSNLNLSIYLRAISFCERLQPRKFLFGGGTEVSSMYEKITKPFRGLAFSFISLYSLIMVFGEFSVCHPKMIMHNFTDPTWYLGVVLCHVLPPSNLCMPTLLLRLADGRTVYSLCWSGSETLNIAKLCTHPDDERVFEKAWLTPLLHQTLANGYKSLDIFEVHNFLQRSVYDLATKSGGIFAKFILALIRKKVISSGLPSSVKTDAEKQEYGTEY